MFSTEQLEHLLRLERVFMPLVDRQRQKVLGKQPPSTSTTIRFVHYTSAEAAVRIIRTKRLWMRNALAMADYSEMRHGLDILEKVLTSAALTSFIAALDGCCPGACQAGLTLFQQLRRNIYSDTFIASISEHDSDEDAHGRLSMWRAFGGNTARVALVMKLGIYSGASVALKVILSPVAYLAEPKARDVFDEVIGNINREAAFLRTVPPDQLSNLVFIMLLAAATCLKHEGFKEEREWRAIYSPALGAAPLLETGIEVIAGVPQPVLKIPLNKSVSPALASLDFASLFDRLIIGPSAYPWVMYQAFTEELKLAGVADAGDRVVTSGIPIRIV